SNYSTALQQLGTLLPLAQKYQAAQAALQQAGQYYNLAGGAQGTIPGLLTRIGSLFSGSAANSYQKQAQQATAALQALGIQSPALPSIYQNQPAAQQTMTGIQNMLGQIPVPT